MLDCCAVLRQTLLPRGASAKPRLSAAVSHACCHRDLGSRGVARTLCFIAITDTTDVVTVRLSWSVPLPFPPGRRSRRASAPLWRSALAVRRASPQLQAVGLAGSSRDPAEFGDRSPGTHGALTRSWPAGPERSCMGGLVAGLDGRSRFRSLVVAAAAVARELASPSAGSTERPSELRRARHDTAPCPTNSGYR
ncbi:unnamed protein product [Lampetra fluviatilis]